MEIGDEISQKIKTAIQSKLAEFGSYVDDELPEYIMVMVANKRSQIQMCNDLNLFLGENSKVFCEWLHELLQKLKEVTEGAFEVKLPVATVNEKPEKAKPKVETVESESLKISKMTGKLSPIRVPSAKLETTHNEGTLKITSAIKGNVSERVQLQSAVVVQKRPVLPASQQANANLLKKAMKAAQGSVEDVVVSGEYNPEAPPSSVQAVADPENKKKQREILLEEHKKLQRLKSQQEDTKDMDMEPMIELEVGTEDDDLFNTEEDHIPLTKDRRIVVEKSEGSDNEMGKKYEHSKKKKDKKHEKRKLDKSELSLGSQKDTQSDTDEPGDHIMSDESQQKSGKSKDKKRKPKFIVTLDGVGSEFEAKYEKERKKKRRRGSKTDKEPDNTSSVPIPNTHVIPIYPQIPHDVPHIPIMAAPSHFNPIVPAVQIIPGATIVAPPNITQNTVEEDESTEQETIQNLSETKCRFWPQCKNGDDCPYYHPGIHCKHFPNCRYGKDCSYIHPPCKFGPNCTSSSCSYSHPQSSSPTENTTLCRYHPFCNRTDCPFLHPTEKPCRYGSSCTKQGCPFSHNAAPPSREQLKWVAPKAHVSDRQFAVNEANTTPLQVQ